MLKLIKPKRAQETTSDKLKVELTQKQDMLQRLEAAKDSFNNDLRDAIKRRSPHAQG
jgi:hypothetical protein